MELKKAIEVLTVECEVSTRTGRRDLRDALKLGASALKRVQLNRQHLILAVPTLLPGETEE